MIFQIRFFFCCYCSGRSIDPSDLFCRLLCALLVLWQVTDCALIVAPSLVHRHKCNCSYYLRKKSPKKSNCFARHTLHRQQSVFNRRNLYFLIDRASVRVSVCGYPKRDEESRREPNVERASASADEDYAFPRAIVEFCSFSEATGDLISR